MGVWRERLKWGRWRRWLVELAIVAAVFLAVGAWQGRNLVGTGQPAPPLALMDLEGNEVRLEDFRGRKVLVYLWAPWCGVCNFQTPAVDGLVGGKAAILSVGLAADEASIRRKVEEKGIRARVLLGTDRFADDWSAQIYPTLYVIDEEGRIEHSLVGYTTSIGLKLRLWF